MLSSNRTWFSLKIADSVQQSGKKRGFSRQILSTAPRYLTTYSNIESTQMFILFLCIILCIFWCQLAAKKLTPQILNYRISVRRIVTDEQFTSASIQPNWHQPASSGPYLGNLPMGGGVPPSGTFNFTVYFNLHALGAAASPLDRTQGGISSTTSNYLFHYDLRPINVAVFELNNPHF